ncbi:MAG: hypothetical protein QOE68_4639 [Thermoanaerobaculia bacterium]|nr:hypothetical protein [Thermoanaerobaculia bacterium]
MIARADFALQAEERTSVDNIEKLGLRDFTLGSLILPSLRKPDFQRETNHWSPEQVVSLLECFVNGDLIPSVILWKSSLYLFVIDGGHRLSVLRGWVEDDYGDGAISQQFFGYEISKEQKRIAKHTRELVEGRIGKYAQINARLHQHDIPDDERRRWTALASRALHIQWVSGNAEKAESSFFKINTEGTPLDDIEELLLRNRRRPIAIAARAVIRAGKGNRYWSQFHEATTKKIEDTAHDLHQILFEPEAKRPVKTLDLPLGGSKGLRTALQVLIDFMTIANRNQDGKPDRLQDYPDDETGESTIEVLKKSRGLAGRITGNDKGSLGLHPAVYFYGPTGVHSGPMFMGTVALIGRKLASNSTDFFMKFSAVREQVEKALVTYKDLIATILQRQPSVRRNRTYEELLEKLIGSVSTSVEPTDEWCVENAGLKGQVLTGNTLMHATGFSDDIKSQAFISVALKGVPCCAICGGYLDAEKSISYDHDVPRRDGGRGDIHNLQLTHPYCNQSVKH